MNSARVREVSLKHITSAKGFHFGSLRNDAQCTMFSVGSMVPVAVM